MPLEQLIANVANVLLFVGGPIIPLLLLAVQIGRWHASVRETDTNSHGH
jgi:hypothetical protein